MVPCWDLKQVNTSILILVRSIIIHSIHIIMIGSTWVERVSIGLIWMIKLWRVLHKQWSIGVYIWYEELIIWDWSSSSDIFFLSILSSVNVSTLSLKYSFTIAKRISIGILIVTTLQALHITTLSMISIIMRRAIVLLWLIITVYNKVVYGVIITIAYSMSLIIIVSIRTHINSCLILQLICVWGATWWLMIIILISNCILIMIEIIVKLVYRSGTLLNRDWLFLNLN